MSQEPGTPYGDPSRPDRPHGDDPRVDLGKSGQQQPPPPPGQGWAPPPPGWQQQGPQQGPPQGWQQQGPPQGWQQPQGGYPPPQQWQGHAGPPGHGGSRLTPADERTWGGAAHWSALIASLVVLAFLGPLLVLLVKGNDSPFVRRQAVESLNFQLTILVAALVSFALVFVVVGFLLLPLVGLAWLVFTIIGAVKASSGEDYRYPFSLRMVR